MATDAEARAAGFATPVGTNLISGGDDAIRQNARTALDLTNAARFIKPFAGTGGDLDNYTTPGLHGYWNDTANIPPTDEPVSGNVLVLPPPAGTGDALTQIAFPYGMSSTQWKRFKGTGGYSAWVRMDAGGIDLSTLGSGVAGTSPASFKTVPLALTVGGSGTAGPTSGYYRMPVKYAAKISRWRLHFRNNNPRFGTDGPDAAISSVWFGPATNGQYAVTPPRIGGTYSTGTTDAVTPWQSTPIDAGTEYAVAYAFTGTATNAVVGGGWSASSVNSTSATLTRVVSLPLDVWIEAEVAPDVPVIAAFGDSLSSGVGATLPVFDSWLSQWARANGALPVHYSASGDSMAGWDDSNHYKWQRWQNLTRPDAVIHAMGSNDVFGGATLATLKDRRAKSLNQLASLVSPVIYSATVLPRNANTGAIEDTRRAYNAHVLEKPDSARAAFNFAAAVSGDDETISPGFNADGTHLNTAGYAQLGTSITAPLTAPSVTAQVRSIQAQLATALYDSGLRSLTALFGLTSGSAFLHVKNGWVWLLFNNAVPAGTGVVTLTSTGLASVAVQSPVAAAEGDVRNAASASRRLEVNRNGQVRVIGVEAGDVLNGSLYWPMTRTPPTTPPGAIA